MFARKICRSTGITLGRHYGRLERRSRDQLREPAHSLVAASEQTTVVLALIAFDLEVAALRSNGEYNGMLAIRHHIATAGGFLRRGASVDGAFAARHDEIDDEWPDLLLLLGEGRSVMKDYDDAGGVLRFYDVGEDALLVFTASLLELMVDRSVQFEAPLELLRYASPLPFPTATTAFPFRLTRPPPRRRHFPT
jgi:hypothetical protein